MNRFDAKQVGKCYINWHGAENRVNIEMWSTEKVLAPGEVLALTHSYRVVESRKE